MKPSISRITTLLGVLLVGAGLVRPAQAQLQNIQQTVFGMDCAPCAHAMERSLGTVEGVESVSVSLNDGLATVDLANKNRVDYRTVREKVENGGFSPREVTLKVRGTARQGGDQWILMTPTGEEYTLLPGEDGMSSESGLHDLESDQQVTVTGQIPGSVDLKDGPWPLHVQQLRASR